MNQKKKGNRNENKWANYLRLHGINASRNSSSGANIQKSDVHNDLNINFECKAVKRANIREIMAQSERDANMSHTIPTAVIHMDGMQDDTWYVVMRSADWVEMLQKSLNPAKIDEPTREVGYWLRQAIHAMKKVLSYIEK